MLLDWDGAAKTRRISDKGRPVRINESRSMMGSDLFGTIFAVALVMV
jgi:hypothetical protein